jgi:ABC-2 type transport system ATP-binding protein
MRDHPAIEADGLEKRYGDVTALDGLSLSVEPGQLYGFLGPNGAGKSTTINVLTGQLVPDAGTARVAGVDPVAEPVAARERVGILPENGRPPSFLTVREYFDFVATARGLAEATVDDRVRAWADRLAFESKLDTLCTDLSQGERQKVLVTQAFVHEPRVVFIDEPLTNLDPIIQERAKRFFRRYAAEGNTVFLSTHFVATAQEVCTRVGIVNRGRLLAELDPRDLEGDSLLDRFFAEVDADAGASEEADAGMGARPGSADGAPVDVHGELGVDRATPGSGSTGHGTAGTGTAGDRTSGDGSAGDAAAGGGSRRGDAGDEAAGDEATWGEAAGEGATREDDP